MKSLAYFYEVGTLLNKDDDEFESYNNVWDPRWGYYNTDWGVIKREPRELDILKEALLADLEDGQYAVIEEAGEIYYDDESDWEEDDLCGRDDIHTSGKIEDVVWSVAKIDNKLIKNFLTRKA